MLLPILQGNCYNLANDRKYTQYARAVMPYITHTGQMKKNRHLAIFGDF